MEMVPDTQLQSSVVELILTSVNLRHKDRSQINAQTAIVGEGLGLDSLDILEIAIALEKSYGLKVDGAQQGEKIFQNIGTLTEFVRQNAKMGI